MEISLTEMLQARENRAFRQLKLLGEYKKPLLSFTMNIAGPIKDSEAIRRGFEIGLRDITRLLAVEKIPCLHSEQIRESTGWEEMMVLSAPAEKIKSLTTELEEATPLGRLFDMDVLDENGEKLSRGIPRRCLICGEVAQACARSRTHSVEELQKKTNEILEEAILDDDSDFAAQMALQSLMYEVAVTPKPGLVDCANNGSHRDMDIFTFQRSIAALAPYFSECVRIGRNTRGLKPCDTLSAMRFCGKMAEGRMFAATNGVNTHKGAVFSMGLLCGALGRLDRSEWKSPEKILTVCADMSSELMGDFDNAENTIGQNLYREYGITGIRGQAAAGYPAVLNTGLPKLEEGLARGINFNESACAALLAMTAQTVDTNMIHRGGIEAQRRKAEEIAALLEKEPFPKRETLEKLDKDFITENLSPGGCADLLSMTFMLWLLKGEKDV